MPSKPLTTPASSNVLRQGVFERAEQSPRNQFSDEVIQRLLDPNERGEFASAKSFLDAVPLDDTDREYAGNPEQHKQFRADLTDFIASRLRLFIPQDTSAPVRSYLKAAKDRYIDKIEADTAIVGGIIDKASGTTKEHTYTQGERLSAILYAGLMVNTDEGSKDLMAGGRVINVEKNISVIDQLYTHWIRWDSSAYMQAKVTGNRTPTERRVYVNPRIIDQVQIFGEIADALNEAGIPAQGKIADHSLDRFVVDNYTRGDSIVFYVTNEHAEALLACVHAIYAKYPESFKGRKSVKIGREIGSGVAIGDEPNGRSDVSLTSHRAEAIDEALTQTRKSGVSSERAPDEFRRNFGRIAAGYGINPENISFNK